jgi:hypothetical protein
LRGGASQADRYALRYVQVQKSQKIQGGVFRQGEPHRQSAKRGGNWRRAPFSGQQQRLFAFLGHSLPLSVIPALTIERVRLAQNCCFFIGLHSSEPFRTTVGWVAFCPGFVRFLPVLSGFCPGLVRYWATLSRCGLFSPSSGDLLDDRSENSVFSCLWRLRHGDGGSRESGVSAATAHSDSPPAQLCRRAIFDCQRAKVVPRALACVARSLPSYSTRENGNGCANPARMRRKVHGLRHFRFSAMGWLPTGRDGEEVARSADGWAWRDSRIFAAARTASHRSLPAAVIIPALATVRFVVLSTTVSGQTELLSGGSG